jgi:hypothetical protein
LPDGHPVIQDEDSGHRLPDCHPGVGEIRHRCTVMRQQNTVVPSRPGQDVGIFRALQGNILDTNEIKTRAAQQEPTDNISIEVLITHQAQHATPSNAATREQPASKFSEISLPALDLPADLFSPVFAMREVSLDVFSMLQIVRDHGVDLGQGRCRIPLNDRLGGRAILKRMDHEFQEDS